MDRADDEPVAEDDRPVRPLDGVDDRTCFRLGLGMAVVPEVVAATDQPACTAAWQNVAPRWAFLLYVQRRSASYSSPASDPIRMLEVPNGRAAAQR